MSGGYDVSGRPQGVTRQRNAVLEAMEIMRRASVERVPTMIAFLYLSENEGLCISELAEVSGLNMATASRAAADLVSTDRVGGTEALARLEPSGRVRTLKLTRQGERLRDQIDQIIRLGVTINGPGRTG